MQGPENEQDLRLRLASALSTWQDAGLRSTWIASASGIVRGPSGAGTLESTSAHTWRRGSLSSKAPRTSIERRNHGGISW
jgi:hypothetical protein